MKIVLGTVQFGLHYGINSTKQPSENEVGAILRSAHNENITLLDTSAAYGNSESILGMQMQKIGLDFKIISKYPKTLKGLNETLEDSLSKLKVKSVYGYLLHHFEVYKENSAIWEEFEVAKNLGKVEKIGFSLYDVSELEILLANNVNFDIVQIPFNIFNRDFEPYFADLKSRGVEIHARSTFLQGLFFMDTENLPKNLIPLKPYLDQLNQFSRNERLTLSQIALNFNLQNPYIDGVLIGVDDEQQLKDNIAAISDVKIMFDINILEKELLNPSNWNV